MSKHTPGPWMADDGEGYGEEYNIWRIQSPIGSNVKIVAEMICNSAETEANARLIAAAPEMYELLQQVADLQNPRFNNAAYMDLIVEMDRLADFAQELLAKIEGGGE